MQPLLSDIILGILLFVTGILLFYYLYFFARLAFYKQKQETKKATFPLSVIVCARNEEENLEKNLPQVLQQHYPEPYQAVVVNDHSEDQSRQVLQWMASNNSNLYPLHLEGETKQIIGKKFPLSIGIREAAHEHLLLTDADCKPASENWAQKMLGGYGPGIEIVLGYGAYEKLPGFLNKLIRFETFHSALQYLSYALAGQTYMGVGRNLSYTKTVFLRHKGFANISHIPGGDDDLFINKAANGRNTAIIIDPDAHTISSPRATWKDWKRQKTRHYSTSKYYKPEHKILLGAYSLCQFLFYPLAIASLFLFDWQAVLGMVLLKSMIQYFVFAKAMKKLGETDLIPWIFLMDLWMFFYYLLFAGSIWKKESKNW